MTDVQRLIDISHHQNDRGTLDFAKVRMSGRVAAVAKLTEGRTWTDPSGARNIAAARAAGLIAGAYHFLRRESDAAAQADHFLAELGEVGGHRGLLLMLDVETAGNGSNATMGQVHEWVARVRERIGRACWLYLPRWWWQAHGDGRPGPAGCGLVASKYVDDANPADRPPGYAGYPLVLVWQHTSQARVPGIPGNCDDNFFYGSAAALRGWAGLDGEEDDMGKFEGFAGAGEETFKRAVRQVLNEGTAFGQTSWAGTSEATLAGVQSLSNKLSQVLGAVGNSREALLGAIAALKTTEVDLTPEDAQAIGAAIEVDPEQLLAAWRADLVERLGDQ